MNVATTVIRKNVTPMAADKIAILTTGGLVVGGLLEVVGNLVVFVNASVVDVVDTAAVAIDVVGVGIVDSVMVVVVVVGVIALSP